MHFKHCISSLALFVLASSMVLAQTPAQESFLYPSTLNGLGKAEKGFAGSWLQDTSAHGTEGTAVVVGNVFNYADLSYAVADTGNHIQINLKNAWSDAQRYKRALASTWANTKGATYWISYLLDMKSDPQPNTYFFLKLYSTSDLLSGSGELVAIGKSGGQTSPVFSCGSGWTGSGDDVSSAAITAGPVWLVVRMDMSGDANSRTFMWVNPDPTKAPDTANAAVKRFTGAPNGFNAIALEYGGDVAAGTPVRFAVDDIRLATTYSDLTVYTPTGTYARESFEYPATLNGLGKAEKGFAGPWLQDTSAHGTEGTAVVVGNVFNYADLSYAVPDTGNQIQVTLKNAWSDAQRYKRALASTWANTKGTSYWISYLLDVKTDVQPNTYFFLKLYSTSDLLSSSGELVAIGKSGGQTSPVFSCGSGWTGSGDDVSSAAITAGPVWLVVRMDMSGDANSRTFMWVNPDPTKAPDTANAAVKRFTGAPNGFNAIALEYGGDVAAGMPIQLSFDAIRLGTSYDGIQQVTAVHEAGTMLPNQFALAQNYPNPFNPSTTITYSLKQGGTVRLTVFDMLGREVHVLVNGVQSAGMHTAIFNASSLTSGMYFYRLQAGDGVITNKMMLLK